jgi:hypothetical protein
MWLVSQSEVTAGATGRLLYHLDRKLCTRRLESPSTEIMICCKRPD